MVRSEKLIELGNSWFSPKQLLGWRPINISGGRALDGLDRSKDRETNQTPNTQSHNAAVRPWGLSSTGQKGNSPDLYLRSLNLY